MLRQTVQVLMFSAIILLLSSSAILTGAQPNMVPTPAAPSQPDQPSCNKVVNELSPCLPYVRGREDKPSKSCCDGAKQLNDEAKSKQDKQAACECIKNVLNTLPDVDTSRISSLPKECGISFNLPPIDRNFDCSTISLMLG